MLHLFIKELDLAFLDMIRIKFPSVFQFTAQGKTVSTTIFTWLHRSVEEKSADQNTFKFFLQSDFFKTQSLSVCVILYNHVKTRVLYESFHSFAHKALHWVERLQVHGYLFWGSMVSHTTHTLMLWQSDLNSKGTSDIC